MRIHISGMCGRVYASLAKELIRMGHHVTGSDVRQLPPVSDYLRENGIPCSEGLCSDNVTEEVDLVLANAAFADNPEIGKARKLGVPVSNFARYLGETFLKYGRNMVVAGSYGKTTTASMLAWIMESCDRQPNWLVGGICPNLHDPVRIREGDVWILEGDEYRSGPDDALPKFHYYNPSVGIVTAIDHVHQDLIGTVEETEALFADFASSVKDALFVADTPRIREALAPHASCRMETVGVQATADRRIADYRWENGESRFSFLGENFTLPLRGVHSCMNAALAVSAAEQFGITIGDCVSALGNYLGVKERQEILIDTPDLTVIHDSGIYPRSIAQVVAGVSSSLEGRRFCILLHPRYTLGDPGIYYRELGRALAGVDLLLVADGDNIPGIRGAFEFSLECLREHLQDLPHSTSIGPAMECFKAWKRTVRPGDVWLILTEPLFPEPVASIRDYIRHIAVSLREPATA